jgi:hypothetical protein
MALPIIPANVADSYNRLRDAAINLHSYMGDLQAQLAGGSSSATFVLVVFGIARTTLQMAQAIAAAAPPESQLGIALDAYVQQQTGAPDLDVHAELAASMTALAAFVTSLVGEYPKDAEGHLLDRVFDATGNIAWQQIPASALPNTSAAITSWLATVS